MTPRRKDLLTLLGLVALLATVALTSPRWSAVFREPLPSAPEDASSETEAPPSLPAGPEREDEGRSIRVRLLYPAADKPLLAIEERLVGYHADLAKQLALVAEALLSESTTGGLAPFPPGSKVVQVMFDGTGTAFVDLSKEAIQANPGGSLDERLSVYALVNTLALNFPAVRRVQILVEDKPAETLAGHLDLSSPLRPDMTLLDEPSPTPEPAPAEEAPALLPPPASVVGSPSASAAGSSPLPSVSPALSPSRPSSPSPSPRTGPAR